MINILQITFSNAFLKKRLIIFVHISRKFVHESPIDNKTALVQMIALSEHLWCHTLTRVSMYIDICVCYIYIYTCMYINITQPGWILHNNLAWCTLMARFMGPTWGPSGAARTQVGPMLALWTLLAGYQCKISPVIICYLSPAAPVPPYWFGVWYV